MAAITVAVFFTAAATAETIYLVTAHAGIHAYDLAEFANRPKRDADKVLQSKAVTFNIVYLDGNSNFGFGTAAPDSAARRARLDEALVYVADTLGASGTLDVEVKTSTNDPSGGTLAFAGTFFSGAPGFQNGSAFTRLTSGVKPFAGTPELTITVNFGKTWHAGTGTPPSGQFDLLSVLIHEVTHGMGILSLSTASGGGSLVNQDNEPFPNTYSVFNSFMRRGAGTTPLFGGSPPAFQGGAGDLTSNDVTWVGADTVGVFGGRPPIHAPATFNGGSSLSHWASGTGAVMQPSIAAATVRREFQPFEVAAFRDIGWPGAAVEPPGSVAIVGKSLAEEGSRLVLTAVGATGGYQWFKDGGTLDGATANTLVLDPATEADTGIYVVEVDTGAKAIVVSPPFAVTIVAAGTLPAAGGVALAALCAACAAAGAAIARRRR